MSETIPVTHPLVRKAAWAVALVVLLPIAMGALVTTLDAGMAFADWPSSDGQNMLLYPWLRDFADHPDKFIEHGHRLAGMLIGVLSIVLVGTVFRYENRRPVRWMSVVILLAVIGQGLLGGARVLLNQRTLAMLHSVTGSLFFCLCVMFLVITGRRWNTLGAQHDSQLSVTSFAAVVLLPLVVFAQYLLGSSFRHLDTMLHEHVAGAVAVALMSTLCIFALRRSDAESLRRSGRLLMITVLLQLFLGLGSWLTRMGFQSWGIVGTPGSWAQLVTCSMHTVGGMLLLAASLTASATTVRMFRLNRISGLNFSDGLPLLTGRDGGVA